ncbi:AEC family transporter [Halobaculum sp. D14]|uniref:AEC family transporter n=1 Tax=unclassified Halobaculum TaxID=2640896 RepID=UPI003EBCFED3
MAVISKLLYMLALLGVGIGGRYVGVLTETWTDRLTWFAFYVALPALVFRSTFSQPLGKVLSPTLVVGLWAALLGVALISWVVHRRKASRATRSVAVVQSYHCNFGFLGLPIVAMTFGDLATAKASILLGIGALTQVPLTILLLVTINNADASLRDELGGIARNPVIAALVVGLAFSSFGLGVPAPVLAGLDALSTLALPIALLSVGASFSLDLGAIDVPTVSSVVALKVFVMPAIALAAFTLLAADPTTLRAGVVMLAMPTAVSTFIYASELGGDARLASTNVFATTVVSLGTVLVLLQFLG